MVPPIQFSGYNYGKFNPSLQYIYDPNAGTNGCYRAVDASDLFPTANISTGNSIATSNGVVLSANTNRTSWGIQNIGTGTLYIKFGSGVSPTSFSNLLLQFIEIPNKQNEEMRPIHSQCPYKLANY